MHFRLSKTLTVNTANINSFARFGGDELVEWGSLWAQTIKKLVDQYAKISRETSELTKEKESLKEILIAYADKGGFEQLFWDENKLTIKKTDSYLAKDKASFQEFLAEQGLLDEVMDLPYYKINTLVKEQKLTHEQMQTYLDKKDSRRLTASKNKSTDED